MWVFKWFIVYFQTSHWVLILIDVLVLSTTTPIHCKSFRGPFPFITLSCLGQTLLFLYCSLVVFEIDDPKINELWGNIVGQVLNFLSLFHRRFYLRGRGASAPPSRNDQELLGTWSTKCNSFLLRMRTDSLF